LQAGAGEVDPAALFMPMGGGWLLGVPPIIQPDLSLAPVPGAPPLANLFATSAMRGRNRSRWWCELAGEGQPLRLSCSLKTTLTGWGSTGTSVRGPGGSLQLSQKRALVCQLLRAWWSSHSLTGFCWWRCFPFLSRPYHSNTPQGGRELGGGEGGRGLLWASREKSGRVTLCDKNCWRGTDECWHGTPHVGV
jgi:hypothetical protein